MTFFVVYRTFFIILSGYMAPMINENPEPGLIHPPLSCPEVFASFFPEVFKIKSE